GVEKVIQGARTESVPLGELKILAEERMLKFDESLMTFTMGNAVVMEDTNGNRKLLKNRYDEKIDNVSAMMNAYVAFTRNPERFEEKRGPTTLTDRLAHACNAFTSPQQTTKNQTDVSAGSIALSSPSRLSGPSMFANKHIVQNIINRMAV